MKQTNYVLLNIALNFLELLGRDKEDIRRLLVANLEEFHKLISMSANTVISHAG